jgi:hypothetical protein
MCTLHPCIGFDKVERLEGVTQLRHRVAAMVRCMVAIARGSTGSCTYFRVICGDKLNPLRLRLLALRTSGGEESLRTLARELAMLSNRYQQVNE